MPRPETSSVNGYSFEFPVTQHHPDGTATTGRIDLYKRGCFVLESKQFQARNPDPSPLQLAARHAGLLEKKKSAQPIRGTSAWDDAMVKARGQAERYARSLPASDPAPPFLVVVDVGHSFELFADFTQAGKAYLHYPDPRSFRIRLDQLADESIRERLRLIWTAPATLDPAKHSADVTLAISAQMAELAKSLEAQGHTPKAVADFLTRLLFCMFAEDIGLLPANSFTDLLDSLPEDGTGFQELLEQLFREMETGTGSHISVVLRKKLLQFSGRLFTDHGALPVNALQLKLLRLAAKQNWRSVEPAIFGTLLERALDPRERHKLGAHYTPRAYVERLVLATVMTPLRSEWENVRAAAITHARNDDLKQARAEVNAFHDRLCQVKVLDPACGSGNFLYVALEHMKRLEGEILDVAGQLGENFKLELSTHTVDPHQFLGIELNPRAAALAELVLWVGYLQWHFRNHGNHSLPPEPVLRKFENIVRRDAVLAYDDAIPVKDERGKTITVWDRHSMKVDNVTGREVPDESKRVPLFTYTNPRPAEWPKADFIIGNPPFLGNKRMREAFGDAYVETLRAAYPEMPETADFVMYWWYKAALKARFENLVRFGLITTNSLSQTSNRGVVRDQLDATPPLSILFAIPDHPWVDNAEGADVRIAMTVVARGLQTGEVAAVVNERPNGNGSVILVYKSTTGRIHPDLTNGPAVSSATRLTSNQLMCFQGMNLVGEGFRLTAEEVKALGYSVGALPPIIKKYQKGRELVQGGDSGFVIDCFGLTADDVRHQFPPIYQRLLSHVKPERDQNNRASRKKNWWIFGEPVGKLRTAIKGLHRYIATLETSKFKPFVFINSDVIPDHKLYTVASDDAHLLGILSSRIHLLWALNAGGYLGVGNDPTWTNTTTFSPFPFPACSDEQKSRIRNIAEELDAHRKRVQAKHPELTLTGMYNVLEKLRANEPLTKKDQTIHNLGLVSVLRQLHDDIDAAVFAAYGWPPTLTDAEILERLVALNAERAQEEASGLIRWLRPEYQNPGGTRSQQQSLHVPQSANSAPSLTHSFTDSQLSSRPQPAKAAWPKALPDRVKAVAAALAKTTEPVTADTLAAAFKNARRQAVEEILETLCTIGQAHRGQPPRTYLP